MPGVPGDHGAIAPESVPVEHRPKDTVPPPEEKIRTKPCRHFENGRCSWGDSCRFLHLTPKALKRQSAYSVDVDPKDAGYLAPQGERPLRFNPNGSNGSPTDAGQAASKTRIAEGSSTSTYDHPAAHGQRQSQTARPPVRRSPRHGGSANAPPQVAGGSTGDVPTPNTSTMTCPQLASPFGSSSDFMQPQQPHQSPHQMQQHHHRQHHPQQHQTPNQQHQHQQHQHQYQHQQHQQQYQQQHPQQHAPPQHNQHQLHQQHQQQQPAAAQAFMRPPSYHAELFAATPPRTSPTASGPPGPAAANPFRVSAAPSKNTTTSSNSHAGNAAGLNDYGARRQQDPRARPARPGAASHGVPHTSEPYQQPMATYAPGVVPSASFSGSGGGGVAPEALAGHSGTSDPPTSLAHAAGLSGGGRTRPPGQLPATGSRGARPEGLTLSPTFGGSGSYPGAPTTPGSSSTRYSHNPYSSSPLVQGAAPKQRTPPARGELMSVVVGVAGTSASASHVDHGGGVAGGLPMLPTPMMETRGLAAQ